MDKRWIRLGGWALVWLLGCLLWWWSGDPAATASSDQWTVPSTPPMLTNPGFECGIGYYKSLNPNQDEILVPNGWTAIFLNGSPDISSTRIFYTDVCDPNSSGWIERLNGIDSFLVRSEDIETNPEPGKPFDVVIYHQVPATYGAAYSFSAWMTSKCGDAAEPEECSDRNFYISKAIGIDPNGGTDPNALAVEWVENRENLHWQNISTSSTALTTTITIFARMTSPFQFHGTLGFMDEFSLVRAPLSAMNPLPSKVEETGKVEISWFGEQSEDIENIPSGTHELLFDVQARPLPDGEWQEIVTGATTQRSTTFVAPCVEISYAFRVRARAEQPPPPPEGASPNHRYPGVWSKPQVVMFTAPAAPITPTVPITPTLPITPTNPITDTPAVSPTIYFPLTANGTEVKREC